MNESIDDFIRVGLSAVKAAGLEALKVQHAMTFEMLLKADGSPATDGDKNAERMIIQIISEAYPEHKLIGEEFGQHNIDSPSDYCWAFDPIDGTWSFINQETTACVNLVLLRNGEPIVGIIYNPFTDELYQTAEDRPCKINQRLLPVTKWNTLSDGALNYQLSKPFRSDIDAILQMWEDGHIGKLVSQGGSPAYCLSMAAKGSHTSFIMSPKKVAPDPWDLSSGVLMVRNAGGQVTDLQGVDINPLTHKSYLLASSDPVVHEETLRLVSKYGVGNGIKK